MPVTLNRLATAFFVFLRATGFGIRGGKVSDRPAEGKTFLLHPIEDVEIGTDQHRDDGGHRKEAYSCACAGENDQVANECVFRAARMHAPFITRDALGAEANLPRPITA